METLSTNPIEAAQAINAARAASQGPPVLGRDDFMKLLVAKLENQDPLQPAQDTEFVAQLATFSSLEQLIQANENLELIGLSQGQLLNSQALTLIGKEALVAARDTLRIDQGKPDALVYEMPREAREATLTIYNAQGETVRTFELERSPSGRITIDWDGLDEDGNKLADGEYGLKLNVIDMDGEKMSISLFRGLPIEGASFYGGALALVSRGREVPFDSILEIREGRG